jgi:hypothetical protein
MVRLAGVLSRYLERGLIPSLVTRVIVSTERVREVALDYASRIREALTQAGILRTLAQRFQALGLIAEIGDIATHILAVKEIPRFRLTAFPATLRILEELEADRRIEKVYPDRIVTILEYPTVQKDQVFLDKVTKKPFTTTYYTRKILGAEQANKEGYTGKGVKIAIIDTTAAPQHTAILHAIPRTTIRGIYTDLNGHGHHTTATVGGRYYIDTVYGVPTQGLAPDATLFTIKALYSPLGFGNESDILEAMDLAATLGADIVSMSLGSEEVPPSPEDDPQIQAVEKLTKENNIIFCIAAGNSGPSYGTINSPGAADSAITVGAYCPITGKVASFSSRGPTPWGTTKPDITMPGVNILAPTVGLLDALEMPRGAVRTSALSGTCLTGDVNIYTPDGCVKLKDLKVGDTIYSYSLDGRTTIGKVVNIIDQGVKEVYEFVTADGRRLIATGNHPVLVALNSNPPWKWKRVDEIKPNKHAVVLASPEPIPVKELDEIISIEIAKAFIDGFAKGDAYTDETGGYRLELASEWLVRDLKYLCDWAGYKAWGVKCRERLNKPPSSKEYKVWRTWGLYISTKRLFKTTTVKKIEKIGEDRVYDITVEPYPHFVAEGIVVHNSMATPHASGMVALMVEYAGRRGVRLTAEMVKDLMSRYGEDVKNNDSGWGVLTWDKWKRYAGEILGI